MKSYSIHLTKAAAKALLKIDQSLPAIGCKIRERIDALANNPYLGIKLQGSKEDVRRIRVGDYRIIYQVYEKELVILVIYVGPRSSAY